MGPQHRVMKRCFTQADIDKGFEPDRMGKGKCTQKVTGSTATLRQGSFTCTGNSGTSSGSYRFETQSREAVAGTWEVTMNGGGSTMKMKSAMQGKWLGADCGATKR
jgi:hypothetical protein